MSEDPEQQWEKEVQEDIKAFLRISRIYAETSSDVGVKGMLEDVSNLYGKAREGKFDDVLVGLTTIYKDELAGVRDREFRWCMRDSLEAVERLLGKDEDEEDEEEVEAKVEKPTETTKDSEKKHMEAKITA